MQVNLLALPAAGCLAGQPAGTLLSDLLNLTSVSPQTKALRQQREEEQRRRRAEEHAEQLAAALLPRGPANANRAVDPARTTLPAAQRPAPSEHEQKAAQQRQAFQRSLADATSRGQGRAPGRTSAGAPARDSAAAAPSGSESATKDGSNPNAAPAGGDATKTGAPTEASRTPQPSNVGAKLAAAQTDASGTSVPRAGTWSAVAARALDSAGAARLGAAPTTPTIGARHVLGEARAVHSAPASGADRLGAKSKPAAAAAGAAPGETSERVPNDANTERILRVLRSQISRDRAQATLRLDPPELGRIKLHLDLRKDALSLTIDPQTELAHRLLTEQLDALRKGLEAGGIQLEHVEIRAPAVSATSETWQGPPGADDSPDGRQHASDADAEHSPGHGRDSARASTEDTSARDAFTELATESLVDILA